LTAAAAAGLVALDAIERGSGAESSWKAQQVATVQQAARPKLQLLVMPAPAIQRLIEAAGGPACIR
jgi:hypothetical protein